MSGENHTLRAITTDSLRRVIRDIVLEELRRSRGRSFVAQGAYSKEDWDLSHRGLGLDSLERFAVAARINEFFALHRSGLEDNLLRAQTLADVVAVVDAGLEVSAEEVVFSSGGTVAAPRQYPHSSTALFQEAQELATHFSGTERVIVTIPVHHIYGFIFGVLIPHVLGVSVVDARWSLLAGDNRPGSRDVVVAVPFLWEKFARTHHLWGAGYRGVTSTAAIPDVVARTISAGPASLLLEVYGSSETSGIGWRDHCREGEAGFELFPWWEPVADGAVLQRSPRGEILSIPDNVTWLAPRRLIPQGRRDTSVQVGGHNVDLSALRNRILELLPVDDCALRLDEYGRISAYMVASEQTDPAAMEQQLADILPDHELPRRISWGIEIPRDELGKLRSW